NIKGTSVDYMYENLFVVKSISGGADNTATVELDVPTSGYTATFRDMVNTSPVQVKPAAIKPLNTKTVMPTGTEIKAIPKGTIAIPTQSAFPISRIEICVTVKRNGGSNTPFINRMIILEDVTVENCSENIADGTTKIKFKAARIGWVYVNRDGGWKVSSINKSGWDTTAGAAWANFQPVQKIF
ncbi:MAG: hypothetical protein JST13_13830, partial [Bacteroidetes bacterium]|nr:hypothetical protein [Bacteroidota bacterium]